MPADARWDFTEHVCKHCLGRIMQCGAVSRCSICEKESQNGPVGICGCGIRAAEGTRGEIGFRCARNPQRSPASPAAVIIEFGPPPEPTPRTS